MLQGDNTLRKRGKRRRIIIVRKSLEGFTNRKRDRERERLRQRERKIETERERESEREK